MNERMTQGTNVIAYLDLAGSVASLICALHCAILPVVVTILPLIGLGFVADESTERVLIVTAIALGTMSIGLGFRRHRSSRAAIVLGIGVSLIALGRLAEAHGTEVMGTLVVVSGGLAIAGAHLLNRRLCRICPACRDFSMENDHATVRWDDGRAR